MFSPASAWSRVLRKASIASTRSGPRSLTQTCSPTDSGPTSTLPVSTVPRPRMKNTSSTVIRNMAGSYVSADARRGSPHLTKWLQRGLPAVPRRGADEVPPRPGRADAGDRPEQLGDTARGPDVLRGHRACPDQLD